MCSSQTMVLTKVLISREQLNAIPEKERTFFIQIGNLLNELNTLQKVIFISGKHTDDTLERRGRNLQALFFVKILAGKLWEAWELLKRDFFGAKLSQEYEPKLDVLAKKGLVELKKYFSQTNLIHKIRNDFAFHYSSPDVIKAQVDEVPEQEIFELLLAKEHGNCLYSLSDVILNFSLLNAIDRSDPWRATDKILDETCTVTRQFLDFLGGCLVLMWEKHIGGDSEEVKVSAPPFLEDLTLPYFTRPRKEEG